MRTDRPERLDDFRADPRLERTRYSEAKHSCWRTDA